MPEEKLELKLDAGLVTVPIKDEKDGELLGKFKFNPNDLDIVNRYEDVVKTLESISLSDKPSVEEAFEVTETIKSQLDYLLGCKVSDDVFAICNPLTLTSNGDFFVENLLVGIAGLIEQTMNLRIEKKKAKIQKATAKYHK